LPADDFGVRTGFLPCLQKRDLPAVKECLRLANAGVRTDHCCVVSLAGGGCGEKNVGSFQPVQTSIKMMETGKMPVLTLAGMRCIKRSDAVPDWVIKFPLGEFPKLEKMKHLLSLEKLARADFDKILHAAAVFKRERGHHQPAAGRQLGR